MSGPTGPEPPERDTDTPTPDGDPGAYRYGPRGEREVVRRGWGPAPRPPQPPAHSPSQTPPAPPPPQPAPPPPPETGTYIPPGAAPPPGGGWSPPPYGAPPGYTQPGYPPTGPPTQGPPRRPGTVTAGRSPWILPLAIGGIAVLALLVRDHHISSVTVIYFCCLIPSIILHEISHGWVALACGDDTAKRARRLTLNPLPHIDPIGTILVPLIMAFSHVGFFGWAKPVPVNVGRLRSPRNQSVLVALAGPFTNVVIAAIAGTIVIATHGLRAVGPYVVFSSTLSEVLFYLGLVNLSLAFFNMIPIPPLDGSAIVERMLPLRMWPGYLRFRQYTFPLVLALVVLNSYLNPGPITWLFEHIESWWINFLL